MSIPIKGGIDSASLCQKRHLHRFDLTIHTSTTEKQKSIAEAMYPPQAKREKASTMAVTFTTSFTYLESIFDQSLSGTKDV